MDFLIALLSIVIWAFAGHQLARLVNSNVRGMNLSPNWWAIIGALFGIPGLLWMAIWCLGKYMLTR